MTIAPQPHSPGPDPATPAKSLLSHDAAALEAILRTDDLPLADTGWSPALPFLSWLVSSLNPALTVDLGFEVHAPFYAAWRAAQRIESDARCVAVLLAPPEGSDQQRQEGVKQFHDQIAESAAQFGAMLEGTVEDPKGATDASGFPPIQLLHVGLSESEQRAPDYLQTWIDRMAPGAVLVLPNTREGESSGFSATRAFVAERIPSTVVNLGPAAEILVAQVPHNGATPLVDLLRDAPPAFRALFAIFAERSEFRHILGPGSISPSAVRTLIDSLNESREIERDTFQIAINATRETMAALATESGALRAELVAYKEQVSLERAAMQNEYFGRLDELTAKLSTSAARYTRELTIRELALQAREREAEMLAGEAAEAQRRLTELQHSSSWRVTAPVRLLSRLIGSGRARDASTRHG